MTIAPGTGLHLRKVDATVSSQNALCSQAKPAISGYCPIVSTFPCNVAWYLVLCVLTKSCTDLVEAAAVSEAELAAAGRVDRIAGLPRWQRDAFGAWRDTRPSVASRGQDAKCVRIIANQKGKSAGVGPCAIGYESLTQRLQTLRASVGVSARKEASQPHARSIQLSALGWTRSKYTFTQAHTHSQNQGTRCMGNWSMGPTCLGGTPVCITDDLNEQH
eukprot:54442-Amphidinium_carterae.1